MALREARLSPTMRQNHVPGERMFVDYAGTTLTVIDASTGETRTAQLCVAVLGASYAHLSIRRRITPMRKPPGRRA